MNIYTYMIEYNYLFLYYLYYALFPDSPFLSVPGAQNGSKMRNIHNRSAKFGYDTYTYILYIYGTYPLI